MSKELEKIKSNIKRLESMIEGYKEELEIANNLKNKYFIDYNKNRESQVIADALTCYIGELNEQICDAQRVINYEKENLNYYSNKEIEVEADE